MKKSLSIILTLAMLFTMCSALFVFEASAEPAVIANNSPAIPANVGDTVKFADYSVVFDGDSTATSGLSWKNKAGEAVTEFKPAAKGVTEFTAVSGSKSKTIYVVAKNASDDEYVLFEDDFSAYSSRADLIAAGYTLIAGTLEMNNGMLEYGNKSGLYNEGRILLPKWIGDFGNYTLYAEVKDNANTGRWFGPVLRIMNDNGQYYPFNHICIRQNTTASNGLEFGGRNVNNAWSVMITRAGKIKDMSADFHSIALSAYKDGFQFKFDGEEIFYTSQDELKEIASNDTSKPWIQIDKGYMGFIASGTNVLVRKLKVTLPLTEFEHHVAPTKLSNIPHAKTNILNPLANVQELSGKDAYKAALAAEDHPGSILVNASDVSSYEDLFKACLDKAIANIRVTDKADAARINAAMESTGFNDVTVISGTAAVLAEMRSVNKAIRTGLEIALTGDEMTSKELADLRKQARGAPATFVVIDTEHATWHNVHELQALALAVWVRLGAQSGEEYDVEAAKAISAGANAVISASEAKLTEFVNRVYPERTLSRMPILIGHRGNPSQAPENSLLSFQKAIENGADVFEIDIEITKDGEIVIMHDGSIKRTSTYTGDKTVGQMTLEEIRSYDLIYTESAPGHKVGEVSDQKVPTLREVLELAKGTDCRIFIEFKGSNYQNIVKTSAIVKEMGMEDRCDVISFNANFLNQTKYDSNMPGMSTGYLTAPSNPANTMEDALNTFLEQLVGAQKYNSTINPSSGVATKYFMTAANDRGMTIWPWTYTASSNNGVFFIGAAGVTTNDVQWASNMYKQLVAGDIRVESGKETDYGVYARTFKGEKKTLAAKDVNVTVLSGSDVVSVENGKIKGLKDGTAVVMFTTSTKSANNTVYTLPSQPVTVVVGDIVDLTFTPDSSYSTVGDSGERFVLGVLEKTTVADFKKQVVNTDCVYNDMSGKELAEGAILTTGSKVVCSGITYTVIVKGDANANGTVDAGDYAMVKRHVLGTFTMNELECMAADVNGDNAVDGLDYAMIKRHVLGTFTIE